MIRRLYGFSLVGNFFLLPISQNIVFSHCVYMSREVVGTEMAGKMASSRWD
jgi:hypothetical protein